MSPHTRSCPQHASRFPRRRRYLELLGRDPPLAPVRGAFATAEMRPQARVPAEDRGARCVRVDSEINARHRQWRALLLL
jgi:RecB family endonuclease NucS